MATEPYRLELIARAASGNVAALTALLAGSDDRLRARLTRRIPADWRSVISVEDVLQETRVAVFRNISSFESRSEDSFDRWLGTIALRRLRNVIRDCRALKRGGGRSPLRTTAPSLAGSVVALLELMESPDNSPSRDAAGAEAVAAVRAAIDRLPADYRDAVRLVYLEGHSVLEVATEMKRTERAVHNLCYKAKLLLREMLGSASRYLDVSGI